MVSEIVPLGCWFIQETQKLIEKDDYSIQNVFASLG